MCGVQGSVRRITLLVQLRNYSERRGAAGPRVCSVQGSVRRITLLVQFTLSEAGLRGEEAGHKISTSQRLASDVEFARVL